MSSLDTEHGGTSEASDQQNGVVDINSSQISDPISKDVVDNRQDGIESLEAHVIDNQQDGTQGSDHEASLESAGADAIKDSTDSQNHARSDSIKKPATFKAVSVTRNFLAKAGTTAAPVPKMSVENGTLNLGSLQKRNTNTNLRGQYCWKLSTPGAASPSRRKVR